MKRVALSVLFVGVLALGFSVTQVWGKAHVPAHKEQVCHRGRVITVGAPAVDGHLGHGDAFIDKRTRIPPLFTGDACT